MIATILLKAELLLVSASFLIFFGYHLWHYFQFKREPLLTSTGFNNNARRLWVQNIQEKNNGILGVQTLRNWTISATFLASTAILLALGIFNFALTTDGLNELAHEFNYFGSQTHAILLLKATFLGVVYLGSFISFVLAVRFYNHASFLISIPSDMHLSIQSESVVSAINQGAFYYNMGMRCYYCTLPLIFWLLGPLWLFCSTLIVTWGVYKLDHGI